MEDSCLTLTKAHRRIVPQYHYAFHPFSFLLTSSLTPVMTSEASALHNSSQPWLAELWRRHQDLEPSLHLEALLGLGPKEEESEGGALPLKYKAIPLYTARELDRISRSGLASWSSCSARAESYKAERLVRKRDFRIAKGKGYWYAMPKSSWPFCQKGIYGILKATLAEKAVLSASHVWYLACKV